VACLVSAPAEAGPWLRAIGETYAKGSLFRTQGDEEFDLSSARRPLFDPDVVEAGRYVESGAGLYVEYGLTRDVTLLASTLLKVADLRADDHQVSSDVRGLSFGMPDLRIGARLPLARGRAPMALEPSVTFPVNAVDRRSDDAPRIGSRSASFALGASIGTGVPAIRGYAQATLGYRLRAGKPSDEWFGDVEGGTSLAGPIGFRLRLDAVDATSVKSSGTIMLDGTVAAESGSQDIVRVAPTLAFATGGGTEFSITGRRVVSGRSALRSDEVEVAFAFLGFARRRP
jgi:hypothetical protein